MAVTAKKSRLLEIVIGAVVVVAVVGVGIFTFFTAMSTPIHQNPAEVPSVTGTAAGPKWAGAAEKGREHARASLVGGNLPGLSVAVGVDGEIVWAEAFGWADLENQVPVAPHMRFRLGHASKPLTSAAVGLLVEKGQLNLDEKIQTYVPAFAEKQWPLTLRQVMGHVAGVRHYDSEDEYKTPTGHCERASDGLSLFVNDPLKFQPESQYSYSTYGWILVSAAVEAAAKEPFFSFMRTQVFEPLGMNDTTSDSMKTPIANRVTYYSPRLSGDPGLGPELATDVDYSCFAGAGAFVSTPSDLVRFGLAMGGGKLLKPTTVTTLQTPQTLLSGETTEYGLGWMVETFTLAGEPTRLASHSSLSMLGSSTSFVTFPERGLVVALMTNTSRGSLRDVALQIAQAFAQQKN